jgi:predicted ATPase
MASSELDFITVKGFKSISSIEKLALRPINIPIGANGSGKSNFIEGNLEQYSLSAISVLAERAVAALVPR